MITLSTDMRVLLGRVLGVWRVPPAGPECLPLINDQLGWQREWGAESWSSREAWWFACSRISHSELIKFYDKVRPRLHKHRHGIFIEFNHPMRFILKSKPYKRSWKSKTFIPTPGYTVILAETKTAQKLFSKKSQIKFT